MTSIISRGAGHLSCLVSSVRSRVSEHRFGGWIFITGIILSVVGDVLIDNEMLFDRLRESQDQVGPVFQRCSHGYVYLNG
jgi:hypothetical protein